MDFASVFVENILSRTDTSVVSFGAARFVIALKCLSGLLLPRLVEMASCAPLWLRVRLRQFAAHLKEAQQEFATILGCRTLSNSVPATRGCRNQVYRGMVF